MRPLLTIVIPCLNPGAYVEECLQSAATSAHPEVEFVFVDGGSQDGSMEIVERYRSLLRLVVSEPDNGQSDALNKGFRAARGEYLTWLNADDVFCPGAMATVITQIKKSRAPWYAANMILIDADSRIVRCCRSGGFEEIGRKLGVLNVFGPSTIFHRSLFEEVGGLREDFHYCMDTEYWWRMAEEGYRYVRIPVYLWGLRLHCAAKTAGARSSGMVPEGMRRERELCRSLYAPTLSKFGARCGRGIVRIQRMIALHYVYGVLDTIRNWRKPIQSLASIG